MTEDEAKTKWCPFVCGGDTNGSLSRNRDPMGAPDWGARCIGSACMAWRWKVSPDDAARRNAASTYKHRETEDGYCGLAGRVGS